MSGRYDPYVHRRRSIRLPDFDYSQGLGIFVTICTYAREPLFGEVIDERVELSDYGRIVDDCWSGTPGHFPNASLDEYCIMPNHVHLILYLLDNGHPSPGDIEFAGPDDLRSARLLPSSLGAILGSFKSIVARRINAARATPGSPVWQRNYYEHVIRDDRDLQRIREYVASNAAKWQDDEYHVERRW
jgi:putative transposase